MEENNKIATSLYRDMEAVQYFMGLKNMYEQQRKPWEKKWEQARAAFRVDHNRLEGLYNGNSRFISPIMKWKTRGIVSRKMSSIFSSQPIGRIEDKKIHNRAKDTVINLWNKYIFEHQLENINFVPSYRQHEYNKEIDGTAVAKITQEYEERELDIFEDEDPEVVVYKDDTYFKPIILESFYTDASKTDPRDSAANIHSTTIDWETLENNQIREVVEEYELVDESGRVVGTETEKKTVGIYKNLDMINPIADNLSQEQTEYLQNMGISKTASQAIGKKILKAKKEGYVPIDECYGKYYVEINGELKLKEVICTIAFGAFCIRLEPTPFKHRRYFRPFIVGRKETITDSFYSDSNITAGEMTFKELNASRQQAIDAKTRSIANMWYKDVSKQVRWDHQWRPNGVVAGNGPNGLTPLINPYLGNITINDSIVSQRDLDQLFSQSPVQEGSSDSRQIPKTATGTSIVVSQNDIPINDEISEEVDSEIKIFLEMLYERNILFKDARDLLAVWEPKDILRFAEELEIEGIPENAEELNEEMFNQLVDSIDMRKLYFDPKIKISGKVELSNERANQQGFIAYGQMAQQIPVLAKRTKWTVYGDKLLRSFGIKDDTSDMFYDEQTMQRVEEMEQQGELAKMRAALAQDEENRRRDLMDDQAKKQIDVAGNIKEMEAEVILEQMTGQKVQ